MMPDKLVDVFPAASDPDVTLTFETPHRSFIDVRFDRHAASKTIAALSEWLTANLEEN